MKPEYDTQMEKAWEVLAVGLGNVIVGVDSEGNAVGAHAAVRALLRAALASSCLVYLKPDNCFDGCAGAKTPGGKCFFHDIHARIDRLGA